MPLKWGSPVLREPATLQRLVVSSWWDRTLVDCLEETSGFRKAVSLASVLVEPLVVKLAVLWVELLAEPLVNWQAVEKVDSKEQCLEEPKVESMALCLELS